MKKLFFAALAATTLFASCAKEQSQGIGNNPGETAKLTVKIANNATRAMGENAGNTDMGIAEFIVVAVDAAGNIIGQGVNGATVTDPVTFETTTAATRVLVISNLNSVVENATTLTELETAIATVADLADGSNARLSNTANTIWSSGEAAISWSGNLTDDETAYEEDVTVEIRPVSAKVSLKVTVDEAYGQTPGNFTMTGANDGVFVLNAVSTTKFFGAKAFSSYTDAAYPWLVPASKSYYSGMDISSDPEFVNSNGSTVQTFLTDAYTYAASPTYFHYYLFENDADMVANNATIVMLKGTWGMDMEKTTAFFSQELLNDPEMDALIDEAIAALAVRTVYFPIQLTSFDAGQYMTPAGDYGVGVQRGKCYNIALELTDAVFTGEYLFPTLPIETLPLVPPVVPPGEDDPTTEITNAVCNVTVEIVNWVGVDFEKEW